MNNELVQMRAAHRTGEGHEILAKVNSGEINPTWEALNKEIEAANQRAKDAEEKLEEERKAREEDRKQHSLFKDEIEESEQNYRALVQFLEQKLEEKPEPVKIIEYQDTLETADKIATLEEQIEALEAKSSIPPEVQKELDKLMFDLKNKQDELDFYTKQNKALADKNKQLSEESRRSFTESINENVGALGALRIRQEWQFATSELQASARKFHTKVLSAIDRESFEAEEHTRTYQTIEVLEHTIAFLRRIIPQSSSDIVDASHVEEPPMVYIEPPFSYTKALFSSDDLSRVKAARANKR